jgi:hypothetical protein
VQPGTLCRAALFVIGLRRVGILRRPGLLQRSRRPELDRIGKNRPVVDMLLPTKVCFGTSGCICQRVSFNSKSRLARAMLMPGIVTDGLDESHIERWHGHLLSFLNISPVLQSHRVDHNQTSCRIVYAAAAIPNAMISAITDTDSTKLHLSSRALESVTTSVGILGNALAT